jgi:hypothetical protein
MRIKKSKTRRNRKKQKGGNTSYTAIIIEPRKHHALNFVLHNILENLNNQWSIIVFHGNKNEQFIKDIISKDLEKYKSRITLISLNKDDLNTYDYNSLLLDKDFYNNIPTETFLVFQTDSFIISKNKDKINDFLSYDYVGAPWYFPKGNQHSHLNEKVGNGGFSLRKKSKMLEIIDKCKSKWDFNGEDRFFSMPCDDIKIYKPTAKKAEEFCSESIINKDSFGIHKIWAYHSLSDIEVAFPEINNYFNSIMIEQT